MNRDREIAWLEGHGFEGRSDRQWEADGLAVFVGPDHCTAYFWPEASDGLTAKESLVRLAGLATRNAEVLRSGCEDDHASQWELLASRIMGRVGGEE